MFKRRFASITLTSVAVIVYIVLQLAAESPQYLVYNVMSCSVCGTLRVNVTIGASASAPAGVAVHRGTSKVPCGGGFGVGKIAPGGEYGCGKIARPLILTLDAQYGNRRYGTQY